VRGTEETDTVNLQFERAAPDSRGDHRLGATWLANRTETRLLIVDDEIAHQRVLAAMLEQNGIACKAVSSAQEALDLLRREPMDALVADLNMPRVSGMELLAEIRMRYPQLVFLMATGIEDVRVGVRAMRQGADDYLIKPLQMDAVMMSLERAFYKKSIELELENYRQSLEAMVCKRTVQLQNAVRDIEQSYADTLDALGAAIDLRDRQTSGHSRRVALCSINMLSRLHGTPAQLKTLMMGAFLHDVGKLAIPDAILLKPDVLTDKERRTMQRHVQIGYDLVKRIPFLADAAEIILSHHERWDGKGYPRRLKGNEIPLNARIFAVADALDAMTSDRPYRLASPLKDAQNEIRRLAGTQFDSEVVAVFLTIPDETWKAIREQASAIQMGAALADVSIGDPCHVGSPVPAPTE
jgi:response regulator RpfG family c-di-GMP phosphodiesterase